MGGALISIQWIGYESSKKLINTHPPELYFPQICKYFLAGSISTKTLFKKKNSRYEIGCFDLLLCQRLLTYRTDNCALEFLTLDIPHPLFDDVAFSIEQKDMGLVKITKGILITLGRAIVDIEINKVNLSTILRFEPVHDGHQCLAGRSPESKEFHQLDTTGRQLY